MSGHKELRERKGMMVKELKCGWPSVFETSQEIKCFPCHLRRGLLKPHIVPGFKLGNMLFKTSLHYIFTHTNILGVRAKWGNFTHLCPHMAKRGNCLFKLIQAACGSQGTSVTYSYKDV